MGLHRERLLWLDFSVTGAPMSKLVIEQVLDITYVRNRPKAVTSKERLPLVLRGWNCEL